MPSRASIAVVLACVIAPCLAAQARGWVPPQAPCDIKPGFYRINSAIVDLQSAATQARTRDNMLKQAQDVLLRSITGDAQDKNPASWYYLGRYYVEMHDAAGADTAFRRAQQLAPQCQQDIDGYREEVWVEVMQAGLRTWQENKLDSAKLLLRQALALRPNNPRASLALGQIYAGESNIDSATTALNQAAVAAGADTAFAAMKKDALSTMVRLQVGRLQRDPAGQRWQADRASRDSVQRLIAVDSSVLARMQASAASRRARGARLAPADQQAFSRDSSARARAVADRRAALGTQASSAAPDSAAAQAAYQPVIKAFQTYLIAYPEATDAVPMLASLYYQSGRMAEAGATFDAIYPAGRTIDPDVLLEAGKGAIRGNAFGVGTALLERGLTQRPYDRDALVSLANGYLGLRDSAHVLNAAQRLAAVDPMNRTTLRLIAAGFDLRGRRDSAQKYKDLADGGMPVEIAIDGLSSDSSGYTLTGTASNAGSTASAVQRLTFDFLDAQGHVQVTQSVEVAALPPQGSKSIQIHIPGTALIAWRYKRS